MRVEAEASPTAGRLAARDATPLLVALCALFFLSGASSLVYQVLWLRMLGWVFGVTVHAASTVWATFMAGLAIGSLAAGAVGDRVRAPLRWLGAPEMAIGVTALATPALFAALQQGYLTWHPALSAWPGGLTLARVVMAFGALILPTALMGATLPLVIKSSVVRHGRLGRQTGLLYGSNAGGAIAGTLVAGLYLVPELGIRGSFLTAAALNLLVGLGAIALSFVVSSAGRGVATPARAESGAEARPDASPVLGERELGALLVVFTLSGFVSLALEVVWFRVLTLFLRPTVYGFSVMLATILAGIALGSYAVTPLLRRRHVRWMTFLAVIQLAAAVAIVVSFGPLTYLGAFSRRISPAVAALLPEYLAYPIAGSLLAIFPTALLMGLAFPAGLHLFTVGGRGSRTARRVGIFYSLNVAGAVAGSLVAGFLLLPWLGSRTSLVVLAGLTFGTGLLLVALSDLGRRRMAVAAVAAAAFGGAVWSAPDPFDQFIADRYPGQSIVWREEGVEATVVVHDRHGELSLTVNGNHEASTGGPMTYVHRRVGHLPLALHPDPRSALVIGLGGGATAGAASLHTGVSVDIVELAAAVVRGARFFTPINHGVLDKPHVTVTVDDGRNFLLLTPKRYDVIMADVILPIWAGAGNLYSAEYFTLMKRVLNLGGLVLQWVAGTDAEYKTIARTFLSVFPHTTVWSDGSLLVGSVEPNRLRQSDFERKLDVPGRRDALAELGVETFEGLLGMFRAGPDELRAFVGDGPLLTDDRPLTEYFLSLPRDRDVDLSGLKGDVQRFTGPD
jgi:spermidine synthase